jgi:hypothetical protein
MLRQFVVFLTLKYHPNGPQTPNQHFCMFGPAHMRVFTNLLKLTQLLQKVSELLEICFYGILTSKSFFLHLLNTLESSPTPSYSTSAPPTPKLQDLILPALSHVTTNATNSNTAKQTSPITLVLSHQHLPHSLQVINIQNSPKCFLLCLDWTSLAQKLKYTRRNLRFSKLATPPSSTNNPQGIPSPKLHETFTNKT